MAGKAKDKNLEETPTFRVAFVVFVFVAVSLAFEKGLHHLGDWLKKKNKTGLSRAISVVKEELMLLGFISLLLSIFQDDISGWCVDEWTSYDWLPCTEDALKEKRKKQQQTLGKSDYNSSDSKASSGSYASSSGTCSLGKEPFMTYAAMHYVHYFIFILAMVVICYSSLVFLLALMQIRGWRSWEMKARSADYLKGLEACTTKEEKLRYAGLRERKAVMHAVDTKPFCRTPGFWIQSFFLQFVGTFREQDYLALRMLFITNHNLQLDFDFHSYMIGCMEDDFANAIGITPWMWALLIFLLIFQVKRNGLFLIFGMLGVFFCIVIGTKLVAILRTLSAESSQGTGHFVTGDPKPTDDLFWFNNPHLLLTFIHFVFFANSLELSAFIFYSWKFGIHSCLQDERGVIIFKLVFAFSLLVLSSYVTLPLYALVSQMGSSYRQQLLPGEVRKTVKAWAAGAKHSKAGAAHSEGVQSEEAARSEGV
ncbi:hypothetical protein CBR_g6663 [Chara braunii]|uniref:MLO-like protein n=1 Tax=Chara braunii TaxID=69332 RepID=A0A388KKE6_CHABU|nr:hypothetical protein CBR_g6663 [Chara braunii]|eukprot:GBG70535.1 hypothetical protein CBR_g6663 [Chara braunii]